MHRRRRRWSYRCLSPGGIDDMSVAPMVKAEAVHKSFGRLEVLQGIDLEVSAKEVLCMIGPSGSGKSTFLRCINHLEKIDAGRLSADGELVGYQQRGDKLYELRDAEVCRKRSEIGMVFQHFNLFPHMTALDNLIEAPIRVKKESRTVAVDRGRKLPERVGLGEKVNAYPRQLSGGQQQRVAIARALAMEPKLMLFGEPTSALDPALVGSELDAGPDDREIWPCRLFSGPRPPEVFEDLAGRVAAVDTADPAARMGTRAAEIQSLDRRSIIGVAGDRSPGKELIQREVAVHDVAADQAVFLLHVVRSEHLAMLDRALEVASKARIPIDDAIGVGLELVVMHACDQLAGTYCVKQLI